MTSGGTPIGQQPDVEVVRVEDVKDDLQTLSSDEEFAAFARKDVDWTAEEERALVRQFGGHLLVHDIQRLICLDLRIMPLVTLFYLFSFLE
jgi:hypothetical protein